MLDHIPSYYKSRTFYVTPGDATADLRRGLIERLVAIGASFASPSSTFLGTRSPNVRNIGVVNPSIHSPMVESRPGHTHSSSPTERPLPSSLPKLPQRAPHLFERPTLLHLASRLPIYILPVRAKFWWVIWCGRGA